MAIALTAIIAFVFPTFFFLIRLSAEKQRNGELRGQLDITQDDKEKSTKKAEFLQEKLLSFEKQNEVLKQSQKQLEQEKLNWQKDKDVMLLKLSEELMKKNLEQQNQARFEQKEEIKKITENLYKNFENVTLKVASLNDDVKKSADLINLTKQALLSPGAAGRTAEITLENILKNSGLKEKADLNSVGDYILQSHFSGNTNTAEQESKRPDAILFFPNNQIAIIDSKSSPHFLDLETARQKGDFETEKMLLAKIKEAFRKHLESLKRKDYAAFLADELNSKEIADYKILNIMFLQTEKMLEILREVDYDFEQRALESGVIIASPIGLINFLSQARIVVDRIKQEKNIEKLKIEVKRLLDNIALIFKESKELGKAINKASQSHNKITKNLNRGVYSSIAKMADLGIESKKSVDIKLLEEYEEDEITEAQE